VSFYRLYCRDRDGHFSGVIDFEARNEAQALRMADRMCWREKRELWHDSSLLMHWDGQRRLAGRARPQPR
jgi:hypothetical protein